MRIVNEISNRIKSVLNDLKVIRINSNELLSRIISIQISVVAQSYEKRTFWDLIIFQQTATPFNNKGDPSVEKWWTRKIVPWTTQCTIMSNPLMSCHSWYYHEYLYCLWHDQGDTPLYWLFDFKENLKKE